MQMPPFYKSQCHVGPIKLALITKQNYIVNNFWVKKCQVTRSIDAYTRSQ